MTFHGRKRELSMLDNVYFHSRPGGWLVVLYGRLRVGKTALLDHWLATRKHKALFWTAERTSPAAQLRAFSHAIFNFVQPGHTAPAEFTYETWDAAVNEVMRLAGTQSQRLVVVLDEFSYVIEAEPPVTGTFQRLWDHHLQYSNLMLVLAGSHVHRMEWEVLAYRSPLYGRAYAAPHLRPLRFGALADFFPGYSAADRAKVYACTGGVPGYLTLLDPALPVDANLRQLLSSRMILDDADALLRDQLSQPRNYASVLAAITAGFTRRTEIAGFVGLRPSSVGAYLQTLQRLGLVERRVPATQRWPHRSKQGRYHLSDPYLRFYYRFLAPERASLERGRTEQVWQNIHPHLPAFVGDYVFKELCREWIYHHAAAGKLPFFPQRVGAFWGARKPQTRGERSRTIDVLAIDEEAHAILLGQCAWTKEPVHAGAVTRFLKQAPRAIPAPVEGWDVTYAFFSGSGFTGDAEQAAGGESCLLVSFDQVDQDLTHAFRAIGAQLEEEYPPIEF